MDFFRFFCFGEPLLFDFISPGSEYFGTEPTFSIEVAMLSDLLLGFITPNDFRLSLDYFKMLELLARLYYPEVSFSRMACNFSTR